MGQLEEFLKKIDVIWAYSRKEDIYRLNVPAAFDIETTSAYRDDDGKVISQDEMAARRAANPNYEAEKVAWMYEWTIGINGRCLVGRTWKEFNEAMDRINEFVGVDINHRIVYYVHNLGYEFGFLAFRFCWDNVFATDERKVIRCATRSGVEFRCSYILEGCRLEDVELNKYKVSKQVGLLNYDKLRHSGTPLTDDEIKYCVYDDLVVMALIKEKLEQEHTINKIPMTRTGYVRRYVKEHTIYIDGRINQRYRGLMRAMTIDGEVEFAMLEAAKWGGYTHASACKAGKLLFDVFSRDETSAYPTMMVVGMFPMSKGERVWPKDTDEFLYYCRTMCVIACLKFTNMTLKKDMSFETPLSYSRCSAEGHLQLDNGRIVHADTVEVVMTNIDLQTIYDFYDWDLMEFGTVYVYEQGRLPTEFVKCVVEFYKNKTTLKGVEGQEVMYQLMKGMVNSTFGMTVYSFCKPEIKFGENGWIEPEEPDVEALVEKYNNTQARFYAYTWGIWICALNRRRLFEAIEELKWDYCYSDTDSVKFLNIDKHIAYFDRENEIIINKLKEACDYHGIPYEDVMPKNIKGEVCPLGIWDEDGHYGRFKTLGAKRYMYDRVDGKPSQQGIHITVAGLSKSAGGEFVKSQEDPFEFFSEDMEVDSEHSGRLTHTYIDNEIDGEVTDYLGNVGTFHEMSCVHLEKASFTMSIMQEYIDYISKVVRVEMQY